MQSPFAAISSRLCRRLAAGFFCLALLGGCACVPDSPTGHTHPLAGRIWDPHAGRFVMQEAAIARARDARLLILGEAHDNAGHHRLQTLLLRAVLEAGRRPVLAMEQFDAGYQAAIDAAIDAARAAGGSNGTPDAERIAAAGKFDREGWRWPDYRPLVALALEYDLPLKAANFSREDARALMRSGQPAAGLPAAAPTLRNALEQDIVEGHCGHRPSGTLLSGMVEAQRARDARMAAALAAAGKSGAVLIAGAGHARRNRGAPLYLTQVQRAALVSLAFIEVEEGRNDPRDYAAAAPGVYDLVWFTPRAARDDPCKGLKMP